MDQVQVGSPTGWFSPPGRQSLLVLPPPGEPPLTKIPRIAIGSEGERQREDEVFLVNGCWDTSNEIPSIIAEMHVNPDFLQGPIGDQFGEPRDGTSPSPRSSDSGIEDCAEGNLSWLLNYKLQELPPVPDSVTTENVPVESITEANCGIMEVDQTVSDTLEVPQPVPENPSNPLNLQETNPAVPSRKYSGPKKPPFTYTELIEYALCENGELTVSGIYQWISDRFPFYKQNDDRWKNSVRHNLSINPHFRKGNKAIQGAGHLWTIAQRDDKKAWQIKQRMQQYIANTNKDEKIQEQEAFDRELQAATESILGEIKNRTAEEHKGNDACEEIEVEFVSLYASNELDFLTPPVSKEQIANECGLGEDYFITDINPNALGLSLNGCEVSADDKINYDDMLYDI